MSRGVVTRRLHECEWSVNASRGGWSPPGHSSAELAIASAGRRESQSQKRLLLQLMRFRGPRGGTGTAGALHRTNTQAAGFREAFQPGKYVEMRAHVGGFFLDPDNFAGVGMLGDGGCDLRAGQRIKLGEGEKCRAGG